FVAGPAQLGVGLRYRRGDDDSVGAPPVVQLLRPVPDEHTRARGSEAFEADRVLQVRPGDGDPPSEQERSDPAHPSPPDPDEVEPSIFGQVWWRGPRLHRCPAGTLHLAITLSGSRAEVHGRACTDSVRSASRPAASGRPKDRERSAMAPSCSPWSSRPSILSASTIAES